MKIAVRNFVRILVWNYIIKGFLKLIVGISYDDNQVLKDNNQYVLIANHNSHLDTAAILSALPKGALINTSPIAAADYFGRTKLLEWATKYFLNVTLIKRQKGSQGKNPIEQMDDALKSGLSLVLFPEGTRGEPGEINEFKKGLAILLDKNPNIPFIPIYLEGMEKAMPKGDGLIVPFNGRIRFGEPIYKSKDMTIEETTQIARQSILGLSGTNLGV